MVSPAVGRKAPKSFAKKKEPLEGEHFCIESPIHPFLAPLELSLVIAPRTSLLSSLTSCSMVTFIVAFIL